MPRSRKFGQALSTKDWLQYRPYEAFSPYDGYYLKLANTVFDYLNHRRHGFRDIFDRDLLKETAILVTCHFEDFISDIGLWRALVRKHEELYGRALPFYKLDDYDPDYLNPQDFAYLLWHHLGKLAGKTLSPFGPPLLNAANYCYDFFEERIDEAPATDFYEEWLDISADTYFFDLKLRLTWMTFQNYLTGPEFNIGLEQSLQEMREESPETFKSIDPGKLAYALENDFLLTKSASWCALTSPDWLAEVAWCPDEVRADIRQLFRRVQGIFLYEGSDERFYHFQFVPTGRSFAVRRDSIEIDVSEMKAGKDLAYFAIVQWQEDWWLSGIYMGWGDSHKDLDEIRLNPKHANFYGWTPEQQQKIRDTTAEMEEAFINFFGERLVFFPDQKALNEAMQAQNEWWNEHKSQKEVSPKNRSRIEKLRGRQSTSFEDLDLGSGNVAAFFTPGEGVFISGHIPDLIDLMQRDTLNERESQELFYSFFHELEPSLAYYLAEHYPTDNLRFPMSGDADFVMEHFDFFLRYYNPGDFRETIPNLTLLPEEE